jgi:putative transposase
LRFQFVHKYRNKWPITVMCEVLDVSRGGYNAWRDRPKSQQSQRRKSLEMQIRGIHNTKDKDNFGSPRVYQELKKMGILCCQNTVAKIMKQAGIQAKTTKKFKMTTDSNHSHPVAENVLNREFDRATGPNQIWVSDITYVWTEQGWLYLACVMDLFSRKVVGWSMAPRMTKKLVMDAMDMALLQRCPGEGLLHHSDRGSQYCSEAYRKLLARNGITCSMSRRGNCWDNAAMESFFGTLKKELVHHERYRTRAEARSSIFEYIEMFYNRERLHSTLGYLSPDDFEQAA